MKILFLVFLLISFSLGFVYSTEIGSGIGFSTISTFSGDVEINVKFEDSILQNIALGLNMGMNTKRLYTFLDWDIYEYKIIDNLFINISFGGYLKKDLYSPIFFLGALLPVKVQYSIGKRCKLFFYTRIGTGLYYEKKPGFDIFVQPLIGFKVII